MSAHIDFYFDVASPYSYLAAHRFATDSWDGVTIRWIPTLIGGIYKATGNQMPAALPAHAAYLPNDLRRCAEAVGAPFQFSSSFPHNSLLAMRTLAAAAPEELTALSMALFRAAWAEDRDVSQIDVVADVLGDRAELVEKASMPEVKERLKADTMKAIEAGAFGLPSFVVRGELFWGNDRLDMAVSRARDA